MNNQEKAKEHIKELFEQAEQNYKDHPALTKRYVELARKIAMKHKVRFTRDQKMWFCKSCNAYLKRGINSTVRIHNNNIILRCKECGFVRRFRYR
jgi:ribonuclease P protein subunit RPR2